MGYRERARIKLLFLDAYGGKCACCGEDDYRFLSLDHVKNDGGKHRETVACHMAYWQAKREGYPKDKYQILCYNCNFAKGTNGGVCPHKSGISSSEAWKELRERFSFIGRKHIDPRTNGSQVGFMRPGHDERRMQLHRRVLKPCPYCGGEFGTNEMTRHKRAEHAEEMKEKRELNLLYGRGLRLSKEVKDLLDEQNRINNACHDSIMLSL
jgi:hypothetical protein